MVTKRQFVEPIIAIISQYITDNIKYRAQPGYSQLQELQKSLSAHHVRDTGIIEEDYDDIAATIASYKTEARKELKGTEVLKRMASQHTNSDIMRQTPAAALGTLEEFVKQSKKHVISMIQRGPQTYLFCNNPNLVHYDGRENSYTPLQFREGKKISDLWRDIVSKAPATAKGYEEIEGISREDLKLG